MKEIRKNKETDIDLLEVQSQGNKGISYPIDQCLRRSCDQIQSQLGRISAAGQIMVLVVFVIAGVCYNISVIIGSIYPEKDKKLHKIHSLPPPVSVMTLGANDVHGQGKLSAEEYLKLTRLISALDSLKNSSDGVKDYQKFMSAHPGLLDSIRRVESLYKTHPK